MLIYLSLLNLIDAERITEGSLRSDHGENEQKVDDAQLPVSIILPSVPNRRASGHRDGKRHGGQDTQKGCRRENRMRSLLPESQMKLVRHEESVHVKWEWLYSCPYAAAMKPEWLNENPKPATNRRDVVPLVPNVPRALWNGNMLRMTGRTVAMAAPVLAHDLTQKILARVHAFTSLGLEAQATAFSSGEQGVIDRLVLLPQINTENDVTHREMNGVELCPTLTDAVHVLNTMYPIYPQYDVFMSVTDICQMYSNAVDSNDMFAMVISPKNKGLKTLCVRLTEEGFSEIRQSSQRVKSFRDVAIRIQTSSTVFYHQIPFTVSRTVYRIPIYFLDKDIYFNYF